MNMPTFTMTGKVALITGGRRGVGKALALAFAEAGADVAIGDYTDEDGELEAVADKIRKLGQRPDRTAYSVSKAGVIMLTRVLARELGKYSVRVNAIAPWILETAMTEAMRSRLGHVEITAANAPLGRFGETDDIIGAALFLASDAASWITGHTLLIDGGHLA